MATTASDIQAQAAVDAWLKSQSILDMQKSIDDAYNAGVGQATASNQQILNQLNASADTYNKQYEVDARSAYLNKMQGDTLVDTELARLGLSDSGFGVSQRLANQGIYSQNLNALKTALGSNLANIDLAKANQEAAFQGELAKLLQSKASAQFDFNKYISDKSEQIRQQEISNFLQNKYYDYLYANLNGGKGSSSSGGGSSSGGSSGGGVSLGGGNSTPSGNTPSGNTSSGNPLEAVARDVIAGKYGNGDARKKNLEKAGYNYSEVQNIVNQMVNGTYKGGSGGTQPTGNSGAMKPKLTPDEMTALVKKLSIGKNAGGAAGANWANVTKARLNEMYQNDEITQSELKVLFDRLGLK
jgi:hypothetical protein